MLGQIIFGLDYLVGNDQNTDMWTYIHPLIQNSTKQLFIDGHYTNAAEEAFIEINDRVKKIFAILKPKDPVPDG